MRDKPAKDYGGDPGKRLEALTEEQNEVFTDHYMNVLMILFHAFAR